MRHRANSIIDHPPHLPHIAVVPQRKGRILQGLFVQPHKTLSEPVAFPDERFQLHREFFFADFPGFPGTFHFFEPEIMDPDVGHKAQMGVVAFILAGGDGTHQFAQRQGPGELRVNRLPGKILSADATLRLHKIAGQGRCVTGRQSEMGGKVIRDEIIPKGLRPFNGFEISKAWDGYTSRTGTISVTDL